MLKVRPVFISAAHCVRERKARGQVSRNAASCKAFLLLPTAPDIQRGFHLGHDGWMTKRSRLETA